MSDSIGAAGLEGEMTNEELEDLVAARYAHDASWQIKAYIRHAITASADLARLTAERDAALAKSKTPEMHVDWAEGRSGPTAWVPKTDLDAAIQRAERAERVSVWAAIQGTPRPYGIGLLEIWDEKARKYVTVAHDKSAADIYRALVEACEGGRDHG